jgi:hypothetical protein
MESPSSQWLQIASRYIQKNDLVITTAMLSKECRSTAITQSRMSRREGGLARNTVPSLVYFLHSLSTIGYLFGESEHLNPNNNNIYVVWPQRGIWLHRTTARSAGWAGVQAKIPKVTVVTLCH